MSMNNAAAESRVILNEGLQRVEVRVGAPTIGENLQSGPTEQQS